MDNYEIEQTLLGKLIVNPELIDKYSQLIHENLFEYEFNKSTYHAIRDLRNKNRTIDILSISKLIKGDDVVLNLSYMTEKAFDFMEVKTCIAALTEEFQKRTLTGIVQDVHNQLSKEAFARRTGCIYKVFRRNNGRSSCSRTNIS